MKNDEAITQARLKEILDYDATSGVFRWKIRPGYCVRVGDIAGTIWSKRTASGSSKYIRIRYEGKGYAAHQLAWLYVTGHWPESGIDHGNTIGTDNSFSNLRLATSAENARNVGIRVDNKSGVKGVYFHKRDQRWVAQLSVNGRQVYWKKFQHMSDAIAAVTAAREGMHGIFANNGTQRQG